jgi:hypothetical protein
MEVAALKSSPLLATIGPPPATGHAESLLRWPERGILDASGHFQGSQSNSPWVSPTGGARPSGKTVTGMGVNAAYTLPDCV